MKKITLILFLSFGSFYSNAQTKEADTKAEIMARSLVNQLELSEFEYIRIRLLIHEKLSETEAAAIRYADDASLYQDAAAQIQQDFDFKVISILPKKSVKQYGSSNHLLESYSLLTSKRP